MWISISTVCAASSQFQPSISMTDEVPEIWPLMGVVSATEITLNRKVGINSESVFPKARLQPHPSGSDIEIEKEEISNKIINGVPGINRVVYDITSKPPSTIELE